MDNGKKPRWGRRLAILTGILVVLLVAVYFIGTSAFFLKSFILPRAGKSMNAEITVGDASISPFSQVILRDLKLKTTEPLLEAREVRLRYSLMDIIKGNINVSEVTLDTPTVTIVKNADGTSNLDPLLNQPKGPEKEPSTSTTQLDVKNVALKNATVRITEKSSASVTELSGLNITLDQLKNGGSGKVTIASDLKLDGGTNQLAAKVAGSYDFALTAALGPQSVKGSTRIEVSRAEGVYKDGTGMVAILEADASPTAINNAGIRFEKGGQSLGQLRARGPFDLAKSEGSLTVELLSLNRNVLNLAGMDFAESTINSTNKIDITKGGKFVSVDGAVVGRKLGIVQEKTPTPPVDLDFTYKVGADLDAKTAAIDRLLLSAKNQSGEFLNGSIDRPLNISWGGTSGMVKESAFRLTVTNLNLADWKTMLGTNPPTGVVNAGLKLQAANDGKNLGIDLNAVVDQINTPGTNGLKNVRVALVSKGTVEEFKKIQLSQLDVMVRSNNVQDSSMKGALNYDLEKKDVKMRLALDLPAPDTATSKTNRLALGMDLDAGMPGQTIDLRDLSLQFTPTARAKNRLQVQAKVDLSTNNPGPGTITVKSPGLDLTPLYDLVSGGTPEEKAATPPTETKDPNVEPEAVNLPIKQLTANLAIDKLFLREIAMSNLMMTTVISNNNVTMLPLKVGVNGAPIDGTVKLNLGTPGYAYDLNLKMDRIPVEPFANSFTTNKAGQYKGFMVADASIRGAGTTGANLQKNLQGYANFSVTNMNLQIVGPKLKSIVGKISLVLRVPELTQTPINWLDAKAQMGDGKIKFEKMGVESEAFYANVTGEIAIEKVLTNSTLNLPVDLQLRRSLAQKAMLLPKDTPTNAKYAALPKFVTIKGTLGAPSPDIKETALLGMGLKAVSGLSGNALAESASAAFDKFNNKSASTNQPDTNAPNKFVQGLGNLFGGDKPASTNSASTNAPSTNSPAQNLLNIFKKPK